MKSSLDELAQKRLEELHSSPQIARSEAELDEYLKKRGVQID